MGRHIMARDANGFLTMNQVSEKRKPAAVRPAARDLSVENPSPVVRELVTDLYERNNVWAKSRISRLTDRDEIAKIRALEVAHPKVKGGRPAVLQALDERMLDLQVMDEVARETAGAGA